MGGEEPSLVSGGLLTVEPIVGVAFVMGDRKHSDFCLEFKKHECAGESGGQSS